MPKILNIVLIQFFLLNVVNAQSLSNFEVKVFNEKISLCDLLTKYVNPQKQFKYITYDSSASYLITTYDPGSENAGGWSFAFYVRHDSLSQYLLASRSWLLTQESYEKLYQFADSMTRNFTGKYGRPVKDTLVEKNRWAKDKKISPGNILKAMWIVDGQKIKVAFRVSGEHNRYYYELEVERFKDYYDNRKLPPWWDGY